MNTQEDTVNAETFVSVNDESNQIQNDEEKEAYTESHHANDVRNGYLEITHDTLQCQQSSQQAVHEIWELSQPRDKASFIDRGEGSRRFQIKWLTMTTGKHGCTMTVRKMLHSVSRVSKQYVKTCL